MAERPVYTPKLLGQIFVQEIPIDFVWSPGFAPVQKKKNIAALHLAASQMGLTPLLEISSKSDQETGWLLSAFNLKIRIDGGDATLESVFQASKVFEGGGPFPELYWSDSREVRKEIRSKPLGRLVGFSFEGDKYPLSPTTAFYDWLYLNALYPKQRLRDAIQNFAGFTDIEFNPNKSLNCQARSCALFLALEKRQLIDIALESFGRFCLLLEESRI